MIKNNYRNKKLSYCWETARRISPNTVPFHMLRMIAYYYYTLAILPLVCCSLI